MDAWTVAAEITQGPVFRAINKAGRIWGDGMSPKVLWDVVRAAAARAGIDKLAPHDLRRTCARLCHLAGGELDQIQFLLGHVSLNSQFSRHLFLLRSLVVIPSRRGCHCAPGRHTRRPPSSGPSWNRSGRRHVPWGSHSPIWDRPPGDGRQDILRGPRRGTPRLYQSCGYQKRRMSSGIELPAIGSCTDSFESAWSQHSSSVCVRASFGASADGRVAGAAPSRHRTATTRHVGRARAGTGAVAQFSRYIDTEIANLREGARAGYTAPKQITRLVIDELDQILSAAPDESPFFAAAARSGAADLRTTWTALVRDTIHPAIARYRDYLARIHGRGARGYRCLSEPQWTRLLRRVIWSYTTLTRSAKDLYAFVRLLHLRSNVITRSFAEAEFVSGAGHRLDSARVCRSRERDKRSGTSPSAHRLRWMLPALANASCTR